MEDLSRTRKLLDQAHELIKQQASRITVLEEERTVLQTQLVQAQKIAQNLMIQLRLQQNENQELKSRRVTRYEEEAKRLQKENEDLRQRIVTLAQARPTPSPVGGGSSNSSVGGDGGGGGGGQSSTNLGDATALLSGFGGLNKNCEPCLQKKSRCDGLQPCRQCILRGSQQACTYVSKRAVKHSQVSKILEMKKRMEASGGGGSSAATAAAATTSASQGGGAGVREEGAASTSTSQSHGSGEKEATSAPKERRKKHPRSSSTEAGGEEGEGEREEEVAPPTAPKRRRAAHKPRKAATEEEDEEEEA